MAGIKSFAVAVAVGPPMLDDQHVSLAFTPQTAAGTPGAIPTGAPPPTMAASPGTAVTLVVAADGLSADVRGVLHVAGAETITISFTNADGTVATGQATITTTIDPAELDVAGFSGAWGTPAPQ